MTTRWRHWLAPVFLLVLLSGTLGTSSSSAEEGPFPGLPPKLPREDGWLTSNWSGGTQVSVAQVARQRQWARTPVQVSAVNFMVKNPAPGHDPQKHKASLTTRNAVYFVASAGAEHNYGLTPEFTVRTVAFGAIPIEVRVQLEQRRDSQGLPLPLLFETSTYTFKPEYLPPGYTVYNRRISDAEVEDKVYVRIAGLRVDGQDVRLNGRCRTAEPGDLKLRGKGGWEHEWHQAGSPPRYEIGRYAAGGGGLLEGTIDVGAFTGCTTEGGDDLSPLLTASASGPNNAVKAHLSGAPCQLATSGPGLPPGPGFEPPEGVCGLFDAPALPTGPE